MKVYVVFQGMSRTNMKFGGIFGNRQAAEGFAAKSARDWIVDTSSRRGQAARAGSVGPDEWTVQIPDAFTHGWYEDMIWTVEEHEVRDA